MLLLTDAIKETILRTTKAQDKGNNQFMGLCPVHGDSSPSLSIKIDGKKALFNCFSGCDHTDVRSQQMVTAFGGKNPGLGYHLEC
jgi:DNA primase